MKILSTFHARVKYIFVKKICHSNPQILHFHWGMWTPPNTPMPEPTPFSIPNGIQVNQPFFHNSPTGRLTDKTVDKPVPTPAYTLLYYSNRANNNNQWC